MRRRRTTALVVCGLVVCGTLALLGALPAIGVSRSHAAPAVDVVQRPRAVPHTAPVSKRVDPNASVTLAWGGDTVLGSDYGLPPARGRTMLAHVAPIFRAADVGWVNLEEALSDGTSSKCAGSTSGACFAFGAPMSFASTLPASGIRIVNLANNHADDYGASGQASTLAALRAAHVAWDGKPGQIEVLTVNGVRVAFLGFAPYQWASRLDHIPAAVALVKRAAAQADVVVVAMHAGAEGSDAVHVPSGTEYFLGENRGNSRAFTHAVIDAGADLVVGSGPHVIRGVQWYRGKLIGWRTFGMGGTLSESGIVTVTLRGDGRVTAAKWTPLALVTPGVPVVDSSGASTRLVAQLSREDFGASGARFKPDGTIVVP
ncbi:MAG TPA: CapA family protein [Gaiellaceae bacterium]|nr:CapA family protein [Gaiellaceae bacterium]